VSSIAASKARSSTSSVRSDELSRRKSSTSRRSLCSRSVAPPSLAGPAPRCARPGAPRVLPEACAQLGWERGRRALPPPARGETVLGSQELRAERLPELARQQLRLRLQLGELELPRLALGPLHQG
jgi:hypothetical protein